jgi:Tol biopolymer transport system component
MRSNAEHDMADRRRFCITTVAMAFAPVLSSFSRMNAADNAQGDELPGDLRRLTEPGGCDNRATYMPDARTLLFASKRSGRSQIWQINADGTAPRQFHASVANDYGRVAINADASRICFSSDREGQNAVYVLDVATGRITLISDPAFWSFGPSWSTRNVIAYFSKKGGNDLNIWTVLPDGSHPHQATNQPGQSRQPWWSPDGGTLAISADRGTGAFEILLLNSNGLDGHSVTSDGSCGQPFWSPDGKMIAFSAKIYEPRYRIFIMAADGSMLRPIRQPEAGDNVHPAWSPDGSRIVFTAGKSSLYVFHLA